jgi:hypothetical protein
MTSGSWRLKHMNHTDPDHTDPDSQQWVAARVVLLDAILRWLVQIFVHVFEPKLVNATIGKSLRLSEKNIPVPLTSACSTCQREKV